MVYIKKWADFHAQSAELVKQAPERTRYLIKATPSQQWLILKVTNDQSCLKFRARSAIIINRFEAFTRDMTALMVGVAMPSLASVAFGSAADAMHLDGDARAAAATTATTPAVGTQTASGGGQGAGGANKKKKKKGKK